MANYTLDIQYSYGNDGTKWGSVYGPAENIQDDRTPQEILEQGDWTKAALFVLSFPAGAIWRVAVWEGHDVDTRASQPVAFLSWKADVDGEGAFPIPGDVMLAELDQLTERQVRDTRHREALVHGLMRTSVPRARIAEAAGVKEARLYQIRDGRR